MHRFALAVTKRIGLEVAFCQLIQELKREGLFYIRAYEAPAGTDNIMRLFSQSHHFESGKVMLPGTASWLDDNRCELTSFPGSKHDDQVDSTTQALHYMSTNTNPEMWGQIGTRLLAASLQNGISASYCWNSPGLERRTNRGFHGFGEFA